MKKDELIELLQRQNDFLQGKLEEAIDVCPFTDFR